MYVVFDPIHYDWEQETTDAEVIKTINKLERKGYTVEVEKEEFLVDVEMEHDEDVYEEHLFYRYLMIIDPKPEL